MTFLKNLYKSLINTIKIVIELECKNFLRLFYFLFLVIITQHGAFVWDVDIELSECQMLIGKYSCHFIQIAI